MDEFDFYLVDGTDETICILIQFLKTLNQTTLEFILRSIKQQTPNGEYNNLMMRLYDNLFSANTL